MSSRRLAILRAQAAAAALTSTTAQDTAYKARCAAFESGDHLPPHVVIGVDLAQSGADQTAYATPAPATADTWHSEPPHVPGVYIASVRRLNTTQRHWDGKAWSKAGSLSVRTGNGIAIEWLRLVKADAAPVPTPAWRRGPDVPAAERTGLWHYRAPGARVVERAAPCQRMGWYGDTEYRPAAPGTQAGDPYDEARYATSGERSMNLKLSGLVNGGGINASDLPATYRGPWPTYRGPWPTDVDEDPKPLDQQS